MTQMIDIAAFQQRILSELQEAQKDLRTAEIQVARLRGQLDLIQEIIQPSITTEGEDNPS